MLPRHTLIASVALLLGAAMLRAQTHKVDAPERVTRAVAVYEWTGELAKPTAARLVPVSLFIDGHLEDAGVYLARPVPFALQSGDVYSVERAGEHIGTLNLEFARDVVTRRSVDDDPVAAWYGYGTFLSSAQETQLAAAREARAAKSHGSSRPGVIVAGLADDADDKPHFVRRDDGSAAADASGKPAGTEAAGKPAPAATGSSPDLDDDPDRPTLRHRDPDADAAKKPKSARPGGFVTPPNSSLNDDPDRPTLQRGKRAEQAVASQLSGLPPGLHQAVAVSDPANREPHLFDREWASSKERAEVLATLESLAQPRIANYIATNKLVAAAPTPAKDEAAAGPSFANAPRPSAAQGLVLGNEQLDGYTLSYGGQPTFVYTVETPVADGGPVYLTMVTQRLPTGELQVALSSVTDATHLDRVPWLRPIDVVDADWSHRASLLFELRAQTSRQFALYRLVSARAEQTFVTGIIE